MDLRGRAPSVRQGGRPRPPCELPVGRAEPQGHRPGAGETGAPSAHGVAGSLDPAGTAQLRPAPSVVPLGATSTRFLISAGARPRTPDPVLGADLRPKGVGLGQERGGMRRPGDSPESPRSRLNLGLSPHGRGQPPHVRTAVRRRRTSLTRGCPSDPAPCASGCPAAAPPWPGRAGRRARPSRHPRSA